MPEVLEGEGEGEGEEEGKKKVKVMSQRKTKKGAADKNANHSYRSVELKKLPKAEPEQPTQRKKLYFAHPPDCRYCSR